MRKLNLWKTLCLTLIFCAGATIASPANTFTSLVSFNGTDGTTPYFGTLVQGLNGALYGTTSYGGTNASGTVFKLTVANTLTAVHSFDGGAGGAYPQGGLDQGTNGVFYGTTEEGGTNSHGTIFQITPAGAPTTLYNFCSQSGCTDGAYPRGWLVLASNGKLYGTTQNAGSEDYGTVFSLTRTGTLTTLHSFHFADGAYPIAGLVEATNGIFYGTTESGGTHSGGTVFKITPAGKLTTLYDFCSQSDCADGENPYAGLIQATDGDFYGTTHSGGSGSGTVFKITPAGKLTTLYDFCSQSDCADGENPYAGLIQATDGNFYGTTYGGGINGVGTIFEITDDGTLSTLYDFCSQSGCADGERPLAGLTQATNGNFYGTTSAGGTSAKGTIFRLATGLEPFVEALPTSAQIGDEVKILGDRLTGTTSVTFNGTPATITVVHSTEIRTTVPSGATTGPIVVTTPSGTLTSNVNFIVN
jgi:uncharacterized repeat protein (TIGR03803 family)